MEQPRPVAGHTWAMEQTDDGVAIRATSQAGDQSATGNLTFRSITPNEHRATFEASVSPGHLRRGLGAALMAWAEAATRDHFAHNLANGERVVFRADADTPGAGALALYQDSGLELAVAEDGMRRTLYDLPGRDLPAGLCAIQWGPMTAPLFFHAYDAAFRERPGFPGWDESRWRAAFTESPEFAPDLSMVVMDGPEPAAFAVLWVEGDSGWITQMGVRPEWRGQGIGEALLSRAMTSFAERGLATVALEVATNNGPARSLYRRLGFELTQSWQSWRKSL